MTASPDTPAADSRELSISRHLAAPRAAVWRCWTEGELLRQWYCPLPWRVTQADLDLRPGGRANTVFAGPDGETHDNRGVYLEVVPMQRLTFTDAYTEGFVPRDGTPFMTGFVVLADAPDGGTLLHWGARHWRAEDKAQHEAMGFHDGWNKAADQLDALSQRVAAGQASAS